MASIDAALDLRLIETALANTTNSNLREQDLKGELAKRLLTVWRDANENRGATDDRVSAADRLQWAIAIGQMRIWSCSLYERQAISGNVATISLDVKFQAALDDAVTMLSLSSPDIATDQSALP